MKFNKTNPPSTICVMRMSAIGDVCHTIPVIKTLQYYWPNTKITWIIGKAEYTLVENLPGVEFIIFDKSRGFAAFRELRLQLKNRRFDILLHLQEALRASLASLNVKADIRLGYNKQDCQDFQWLFCNTHVEYKPRIHYMERLLLFTDALGLSPPTLQWDIPIGDENISRAQSLLPIDKPFVVISPCSSVVKNNYRNWTTEHYIAIAEIIEQKYHHAVVLTGGNSGQEKVIGEQIVERAKTSVTNLIGKLNLKQLLYALKSASAVISPDSGPAHMANSVGTPVIGLFYSSNPNFTGPYNNRDWIVNRYPDALRKYLNLSIDEAKWGQRVRVPEAASLITLEDVENKLDKLKK